MSRERGDLTLEEAVHQLTGRQAEVFGFRGRGRVEEGAVADLAVFALDELHWDDPVMAADLPGGATRLRRGPGGYRYTIVDGIVTQDGGELGTVLPGRMLRQGAA
jgi:N-acyl-D-aspartate/D-glutamate deacylase